MGEGTSRFRGDIDGLRGLAILLVVLYHAHVPGFDGGFIGVDVFFVISGYLISRNLFAEMHDTGSVALLQFWGKRIRRLVPALALMVTVVFAAGLVILSPLEWPQMARDGAASIAYVSNIVYALNSTDYFGTAESIFQHTWSLSVEEQFYVVWPLLMLPIAWIGRAGRRRSTAAIVTVLVAMTVVSFALNVLLADRGSTWAFYSLPTRMWEFGIAGLLAAAQAFRPMRRRVSVELATIAGLAAIVAAAMLFDDRLAYPGTAALVPVLATALIIRAGSSATPATSVRALAAAPCQRVGRVSYSWYLWHWPVILLTVAVVRDNSPAVRSAGALLSLGFAVVALRFVENPIRFSPKLKASLAKTYGYGAAASVLVLLLAVGVHAHAERVAEQPFYARLSAAAAMDVDANGQSTRCAETIPTPDGGFTCIIGDAEAPTSVMLVGDSHATHWVPVFDQIGQSRHLRIVLRSYGNCPAPSVPISNPTGPVKVTKGCEAFRQQTAKIIEDEDPAVVILSNATYQGWIVRPDGSVPSTAEQLELWDRAYRTFLADTAAAGPRLAVILDNPAPPFDPITCVGRTGSAARCDFTRSAALRRVGPFNAIARAAAEDQGGVTVFDPADTICGPERCVVERDGEYVFRDGNHLTDAFAISERAEIEALLDEALGPAT